VAQEFIAGETLHSLAKRHDISRNLIRIWVAKYEAGEFDDDAEAADMLQAYEAGLLLSSAWLVGRHSRLSSAGDRCGRHRHDQSDRHSSLAAQPAAHGQR
jgi:transposase-like protein